MSINNHQPKCSSESSHIKSLEVVDIDTLQGSINNYVNHTISAIKEGKS
jgi:hypothetical protein